MGEAKRKKARVTDPERDAQIKANKAISAKLLSERPKAKLSKQGSLALMLGAMFSQ